MKRIFSLFLEINDPLKVIRDLFFCWGWGDGWVGGLCYRNCGVPKKFFLSYFVFFSAGNFCFPEIVSAASLPERGRNLKDFDRK